MPATAGERVRGLGGEPSVGAAVARAGADRLRAQQPARDVPLPARELRSQRGRLVLSQHADLTVGVDFKLDPDFDGNAQYPTSAYAATRNIRFELPARYAPRDPYGSAGRAANPLASGQRPANRQGRQAAAPSRTERDLEPDPVTELNAGMPLAAEEPTYASASLSVPGIKSPSVTGPTDSASAWAGGRAYGGA